MRRPSLRRRLLWLVGLPVFMLWLVAGAWLAQRTAHETTEIFNRELERTAASVLMMVTVVSEKAAKVQAERPRHKDHQRPEFIVRDRAGRLVLDASTLPAIPAGAGEPRFRTVRHKGERWRIYQRWDTGHRYWIQVAVPLRDREELLAADANAVLIPLAALLLFLPLVIWLGLRGGLAPLHKVSRAIATQPRQTPTLTHDDVPGELLQLTRALDEMVTNLNGALLRERRFTADAAHELRHPLSVLQMELDLVDVAPDEDTRRMHLQRARDGLERMERLVAQLLTLARVESLDQLADAGPLDAAELAREVVAEAGEHAAPRGTRLALWADPAVRVQASAGLLGIALRNLLDNAIAHGKMHGEVSVAVSRHGDAIELAVEDDGPGISETQAERLGERFRRGVHSSGSGLGLSIVHAIASLHGGSVVVARSAAGGARVVLRLPAVATPSPS